MTDTDVKPCEKKSKLTREESLPQTLKKLREKNQGPSPSDATKKFLEDVTFVETGYNGIPPLVIEYEEAYPNYQRSGSTYNAAECQWREIEKWDQGSSLETGVKSAIRTLRESYYRDENDVPLNDSHPKKIYDKAVKNFRLIKSCYEQRTAEEEEAVTVYNKIKDYKKAVEGWFADLKGLHEQAKNYYEKKQARSLHAVYLEAAQVWGKICHDIKTPQALKNDLTNALWGVLEAKHERYKWHQDWLDKQLAVTTAKANYDAFTANRRRDFLREAEDVEAEDGEAEDGETKNGETGNGAAEGPVTYGPSTPAERY